MRKLLISMAIILSLIIGMNVPSLAGGPKVYDANNQFLGILVDISPTGYGITIFIPGPDVTTEISWIPGNTQYGDIVSDGHCIFYEDSDCAGNSYGSYAPYLMYRFGNYQDARYFMCIWPPIPSDQIPYLSRLCLEDGVPTCTNLDVPELVGGGSTVIEISKEKIPFTLPFLQPVSFK